MARDVHNVMVEMLAEIPPIDIDGEWKDFLDTYWHTWYGYCVVCKGDCEYEEKRFKLG